MSGSSVGARLTASSFFAGGSCQLVADRRAESRVRVAKVGVTVQVGIGIWGGGACSGLPGLPSVYELNVCFQGLHHAAKQAPGQTQRSEGKKKGRKEGRKEEKNIKIQSHSQERTRWTDKELHTLRCSVKLW